MVDLPMSIGKGFGTGGLGLSVRAEGFAIDGIRVKVICVDQAVDILFQD
jgi:hypothetical protein